MSNEPMTRRTARNRVRLEKLCIEANRLCIRLRTRNVSGMTLHRLRARYYRRMWRLEEYMAKWCRMYDMEVADAAHE